MKRRVVITTGDYFGIGPEVISKGLLVLYKKDKTILDSILLFGSPSLYSNFLNKKISINSLPNIQNESSIKNLSFKKGSLNLVEPTVPKDKNKIKFEFLSSKAIELAINGCLKKTFSALVTGPIDKKNFIKAGYQYHGHTELIEALCQEHLKKTVKTTMMLCSKKMRVSLVTTHIALSKVSSHLNEHLIKETILNTISGLKNYFNINKPRIAVLALNPHGGEGSLFGTEESDIIQPCIEKLKKKILKNALIEGPFSADGFFSQWQTRYNKQFDAIVCMYHDQGLIPIKLYDFKNSINLTLGVPILRTSVDHGVGYDIVGKNCADPSSFIAALELALKACK
jgi:4-hydroxythreonine-4-phosphate dehydrogenase